MVITLIFYYYFILYITYILLIFYITFIIFYDFIQYFVTSIFVQVLPFLFEGECLYFLNQTKGEKKMNHNLQDPLQLVYNVVVDH